MPQPSSISRRIQSCINYVSAGDYESAMVNFTAIATGHVFRNIFVNGVSFPEAMYKFGRTPIAHEGELDPRLTFNDAGALQIGNTWNLPSSYITGLCVGVMVAQENTQEFINAPLSLTIFGHEFQINELWGAEPLVKKIIADAFRNPHLFD